ncbi:MAG: SusC/RagA family TonB-linked outer membrane protein [Phocaeicola sp.]|uniref:SusC/RagA family TonB-linked outer membrane protein n=1 Tax=Phocaeicola sp. TaxID=2773926 RepID=UPI003FA14E97
MRKKNFLAICCFALVPVTDALAINTFPVDNSSEITQQSRITVKGSIKDSKGEPVIGAAVKVKGTTIGTISDFDGNYTLEVPRNAILEISYVGYDSQKVAVSGKSTVNITLAESTEQLGEVVVTAMGIVRNTRTLSYSTQSVRGDELTAARGTSGNVLDALKGKIAGADINTTSQLGGASRIVLRGVKSVGGGANALIVIDGVPIQNPNTGNMGSEWQSYMGSDGAVDINPDDILSMDVLKGPSAAALYGSDAANGAIIITTKSGKEGHFEATYNGSASVDMPVYLMKMQNTYGRGNGGVYAEGAGESWGTKAACYPDNFKDVFRNGTTLSNSVSFQGGNKDMKGFASYTNNHSIGNIPNNFMNKNTFDVRVQSNFIKNLSTDAKITYSQYKINGMPPIGDTGLGIDDYIMPRDMSISELRDYEGVDEGTGQPVRKYWTVSSVFDNPYWVVNHTRQNQFRKRLLALFSVKYDITPWLNIQGRYSYDYYYNKDVRTAYHGTRTWTGQVNTGGYMGDWRTEDTQQNMDVLLNGENHFGDFKLTYNLGATDIKSKYNGIGITGNGLSITNKFHLGFATAPTNNWGWSKSELQAVYGTAQLGWKEALYLDVTGRNDWSSTLPANYSYFYPSVGLTGILSELFKMPEWISFSKLRASWAKVGASAGAYMLAESYSYDSNNGYVGTSGTKMIPDLKPEMTTSWEIGTEWKFLNNRLGIDFTYYDSRTKNQLITVDMPWSSGYSNRYINCGRVDNKGIELSINARPIETKDFLWSTTVNIAHNKNKLVTLYENLNQYQIGGSAKFSTLWSVVGEQIGELHGQTWQKNAAGQYVVDADGLPVLTDSSEKIGNYNPKVQIGWSNSFNYKRFNLNFLIDGKIGGVFMSATDAVLAFYGVGDYTAEHREGSWVLDAVTEDGSQNTKAITSESFWKKVSGGRYGAAGFFTYDATNFRLRNIQIGYDIPLSGELTKYIKTAHIALTGHNLFFFYRGKNKLKIPGLKDRSIPVDPDQAVGAGSYQGSEMGLLPSTRSIGVNLNLTF